MDFEVMNNWSAAKHAKIAEALGNVALEVKLFGLERLAEAFDREFGAGAYERLATQLHDKFIDEELSFESEEG
jgi:cyclopropane fatty-acyl-phospholipid synthase-like methyltransferase